MVKPRRDKGRTRTKVAAIGTVWAVDLALVGHVSMATREGWTEQVVERPTRLFHDVADVLAALTETPAPFALVIGMLSPDGLATLMAREELLGVPILISERNFESTSEIPLPSNVSRYDEAFHDGLIRFKREVLDNI